MLCNRLGGAVVVVAAAQFLLCCDVGKPLQKGEQLFAISEEAIIALCIQSREKRVEAHRFGPDKPFYYSFETEMGERFERCPATDKLDDSLRPFRSVRIRGVLQKDKAKATFTEKNRRDWIDVELHDFMEESQTFRLHLMRHPNNNALVYAQIPGDHRVLLLDAAILSLLYLSCEQPRQSEPVSDSL